MKVRKWTAAVLCMLLLLSLAGCGGAAADQGMEMASPMAMVSGANGANKYMVAETTAASLADEAVMEEGGTETPLPADRKWIITMDISAETEDLDGMLAAVNGRIAALSGYVQDQRITNGSKYASNRYRSANLTIRIPAEQVDAFTQTVSDIANVVRSSKNLEDITLQYVATESRLKALQTEEARLLELMAKAENMTDLLEIERRLTDVRYELENITRQLRSYDNLVNYATIYLYIEEVKEYTPVKEETFFQRITGGFAKSLKGVGKGIVECVVWFIVKLPYIVVFCGVGGVLLWIIRRLPKKKAVKKARRKDTAPEEKPEEKEAE